MERLTQRIKTGEVLMASEYEEKYTTEEWICMLQDRVADYEDTGLTPEQVVNAKTIIESAFADDTSKAERIRKLVAADDEGRVVVLPPENYVWKIRGDIALGIIAANCRRAEAERAMQEMDGK